MFKPNNIEALLVELRKDLQSVAHKTNNLAQNMQDLNEVIYKGPESIQHKLQSIESELQGLNERLDENVQNTKSHESRLIKLEQATLELSKEQRKNDKLKNLIIATFVSFLIPVSFTFLYSLVTQNYNLRSVQTIQKS